MRILHTADWHLGRTMRGRSRGAEFEAVLSEVVEVARSEEVEAMLVCGDIWDTASPAPETDRLLNETLRECIGHGIQVVLLAGNHDNPRKLAALGLLSDLLGVQTQSDVLRPNAGGVLTVEGREHVARIAAVPWVPEGRLVDAVQVMGLSENWYGTYADGVAELYAGMCAGFAADTVNILAAHVFIDGARLAAIDGSERLLHIGQAYGVSPARIPTQPQFVALGHIHEPQEVLSAPVPTSYSGSLLQLDFGERGQQKVVRIIDAAPGQPVEQRAVHLSSGRALVELRGTPDEVLAQAEGVADAHLRVRLEVESPEPGLAQRMREELPALVDVQLEYDALADLPAEPALGVLTPEELFVRYYRAQHGAEPNVELLALFRELLAAEVDDESLLGALASSEEPASVLEPEGDPDESEPVASPRERRHEPVGTSTP